MFTTRLPNECRGILPPLLSPSFPHLHSSPPPPPPFRPETETRNRNQSSCQKVLITPLSTRVNHFTNAFRKIPSLPLPSPHCGSAFDFKGGRCKVLKGGFPLPPPLEFRSFLSKESSTPHFVFFLYWRKDLGAFYDDLPPLFTTRYLPPSSFSQDV